MSAYPECYVNEIVDTQGKLFEYVADFNHKIDMEDFINNYMQSRTRSFLDHADAYLSNLNASELFRYYCETENYTLKHGNGMLGAPDWIGQFYAYYQWLTGTSSKDTIKKLPLDFVKASYYGLHDLDLDLAVKKVETEKF